MHNVGVVQQTEVLQEHAFKVFKAGQHLLLHFQPIDPTCRIARHQGDGVLAGLECWLPFGGHMINTNRNVVPFKGGEPQMGSLSLACKRLGLCQLGGNQNRRRNSHDHTCTKLQTESHKSDID